MSADDFQTKYASVMESMLKSAVAETTKLFETMVDELKAEISRIKQENEVLKMRCKQFESERSRPAAEPGDGAPLRGRGGRDAAVQCGESDLAPLRTVLVEQCQPLRYLSLHNQEQQRGDEKIKYALQESNCEAHSQMDFILVKHKEKEVYPTMVCRQLFSDKAGSTLASVCRTESEGAFIHQECLTGKVPLLQKDEETRLAVELLQGPQNQSPERKHSIVISLASVNEDMEEPLDISQKISEIGTQGEHITSLKQQLVVALHELDVEPLEKTQSSVVPQQTDVALQQNPDARCTEEQLAQPTPLNEGEVCDEFKVRTAGGETCSRPDISVPRRRGRPPKKRKHLQQLVKAPAIPAVQEVKNSPAIGVENADISSVLDSVSRTSSESPRISLLQPEESSSIIMSSAQKRANTASEDKENSKVGSLASLSRRCSSEKGKSSESQHPSMDTEEASIEAPPTEVSSATEKRNTPPVESPPSLTVQPRERHTSATLQDAMLLVEAMNRSTAENALSSPQRRTAQIQCGPHADTLEIVQEIPAETQKQDSLPVETHEATGNLPPTEPSSTKSTIQKHSVSPQTPDVRLTDKAQAHIKVAFPNQVHEATLSRTTLSSVPLSTTTTQTSVRSLQQPHTHPLTTVKSVAPRKPGNTVPNKIIVVPRSSLMPPKILALSPTQIPNVVSTVVAKLNGSILQGSTASGYRAPSIPSVPQERVYVTSRKSFPVVTSQSSTTTSTDPQSGALPQQKITIIIPRQASAVASRKHQSQTIALNRTQESDKSATPVTAPLSQLTSSSKELFSSSAGPTMLSQKRVNTSSNLDSLNTTSSVSETRNGQTETCSNLQISAGPVSACMSAGVPSTAEEKLSAVVRLTRFPFPVSTKKSVLVSKLPTNEFSEAQSVLKEGGKHEKPFVPLERHILPTDSCPNLKQTSTVSVNFCQGPQEPNDIQEKSTSMNKSSAVSDTTGKPTSNVDADIISMAVQDCALIIDSPIEENQSAGLIHHTSITSRDISDPHLQMNKSQFLVQLAESPVAQDPKHVSSNDSVDAEASCAETSTSDKKILQKRSLVAQLRSHLKDSMRYRRTKTNPEPQSEAETPNDKNISSEHSPLSPENLGALEDVASLKKTTVPTSIRPKRIISEPSYVRRSKATNESTSLSPRRSSSRRASRNEKSTSVSPRSYCSTKASASQKKTQDTCVHPKRTGSSRDGASSKVTNPGGSPNNTKTISVRPKRTSACRDSGSFKTTEYTSVSPSTSSLTKNGTMSKLSTNESTSFSRRGCSLIKDGSSTEQIKKESNSLNPKKCSISTDGASTKSTDSETVTHIIKLPKSASDSVTLKMSGESTLTKKPRISQAGLRVVNARMLAKAGKAKTIAKVKKSQSELQNEVKTNPVAEKHASCEVVKRGMAKAVWTPPRMPASKTSQLTGKMSSLLSLKDESRSPISLNRTVVYPPSVSLHPIPVRGSPIVSPLQPLSVIGRRLLKNQCGVCGRILSSSAALESHVSLHTGNRPFSCSLCGKCFPDSKGFKRHGRVHRNGRIHICPQCGKGFVYRFGLTKHLQMVHGRIRPFVCQICNKGFFTKRDVEAHIRIHTGEKPFHCNLCEKKFTRRVELNVHLRWHNGEKRHWCPYCGKGFLDFNNLKRHKYIHTGEKPHSCPHCPKNFTQSGHLKKHIKNVHKIS